ncbi:MAG TPA: ABC transporter permease [Acidimicrobiales bacterium]|jgi:ABC-type dipeptide/oligopeptide/nickel transport system permease component|nr:ABC transporter permease [Acidimicrobiales bacterium]
MLLFTLRRVAQLIFTVLAGVTLLFFLVYAIPDNPAELAVGGGAKATNPQVVKNTAKKLGLDRPMLRQYQHYMDRLIFHFDFGTAYSEKTLDSNKSVNALLKQRAPVSIRLATWAIIIEIVIGLAFGVLSARRRNSLADTTTTVAAVVASAIPVFVLGYLLIQLTYVFANQHHLPRWMTFPNIGLGPGDSYNAQNGSWFLLIFPRPSTFKYLVQPAIVLAAVTTAILTRIVRTTVLETSRMDHVRTARAKGLSEKRVMRRHVTRNAMIPVVTVVGLDFGTAAGAAILTETVFNLKGLGYTVAHAAANKDLPAVLGFSVVVMLIYGVANLVVDLSYALLDPRVRLGEAK